jgi:hypothetical protein
MTSSQKSAYARSKLLHNIKCRTISLQKNESCMKKEEDRKLLLHSRKKEIRIRDILTVMKESDNLML